MMKTTYLKVMILALTLVIGTVAAKATYSGTGTFTKITSLEELTDGYYVLVNSGDAFAMNNSTTQVANCLGNTAVTPTEGTITNPATTIVWKIESNSGSRTIYNEASAKFVSYTGASNNVQVVDAVTTDNQRWNFTYGSDVFTIANVALTTRVLQYNSSSPRFACYTSSQQKILLYKLVVDETCTASTLSFANATVSKTMGDAAFTIAATSLNTTTAITYESNNTAVATVNESTGEVTIVSAGTSKIKATQAAGTHASVAYCAANVEYTLNVATNLPTITVTEVLPAFIANVGANDQKTLTVTGANLTADIALTITGDNAAMFSVTNTLPAVGGTATITYSPTTPGAHTATLALNSAGATEVLVTLNGTSTLANAVATVATAVGPTSFTANWNAVAGATGYELEVYTKGASNNTNLLVNGGFEESTSAATGWTIESGTTSSISATIKNSGDNSLYATVAATKKITQSIAVENGKSYKLTLWYFIDNTSTGSGFRVWTTTGTTMQLPNSSGYFNVKDSWEKVEHTFTATANTVLFELRLYNGVKIYLDDISIVEASGASSPVGTSPITVGANVTSYNVTGLTVNTDYYYTVTAKYNDTASAKSNEIKVTTSETTNSAPSATMQSLRKVGNQIVFETSAQQSVEIFNVTGQRLMSTTSIDGVNAITVNTKGLVLVKIGKETAKVIM